jgi:hypothetical protein
VIALMLLGPIFALGAAIGPLGTLARRDGFTLAAGGGGVVVFGAAVLLEFHPETRYLQLSMQNWGQPIGVAGAFLSYLAPCARWLARGASSHWALFGGVAAMTFLLGALFSLAGLALLGEHRYFGHGTSVGVIILALYGAWWAAGTAAAGAWVRRHHPPTSVAAR